MRIKDKLFSSALVELLIALRRLLQGNYDGIDCSGNLYLIVQDRIHQLAVVTHDRALTSNEREGLGPAQTDMDVELANPGFFIDPTWVGGHIQARDPYLPANTSNIYGVVQCSGRSLSSKRTMAVCLKSDTIDSCVHHRLTEDLGNHIG